MSTPRSRTTNRKPPTELPLVLSKHSSNSVGEMQKIRITPNQPSRLPPIMSTRLYLKEVPPAYSRNQMLRIITETASLPDNRFNRKETSTLVQLFLTTAKKGGFEGGMLPSEFRVLLFGTLDITDPNTLDGLCRAASTVIVRGRVKCEKTIHLPGFIRTLSTLLRGDLESRAALAFDVLDIDMDGYLQEHLEMRRLLKRCIDVDHPEPGLEDDPYEAFRDFGRYIQQFFNVTQLQPLTKSMFIDLVKQKPFLLDTALPVFPEPYSSCTFEFLFGTPKYPELD
ncbi:unnamed protein product [Dibothriocephalus latus]|uniref:EF-hand domain-containing protein n=1 Tax=Dibothriocephalus latus TaxID=60516 RepID=A0A3P7P273_DIBLA|nr:unnamed protein product [Dibothriocephalus latus]